eukprot:scaffold2747_cov104-Cylindrotheca_fusiformis.AAC.5
MNPSVWNLRIQHPLPTPTSLTDAAFTRQIGSPSDLTFWHMFPGAVMMERPNMEERNKRKSSEIDAEEAPEYFVYTNEMKEEDIPKQTLTHMRVDCSVRELPERAFANIKTLVHVQLPETLTRIGEGAFERCFNLKLVQFVSSDASLDTSSSNASLEDETTVFPERAGLQIEKGAFNCCNSLRKLTVHSVSTRLCEAAFTNCRGLLSAELPEGLEVVQPNLFSVCLSLKTVKIPSSVIRIGDSAFSACPSLTSVDLPHGLLTIGNGSFSSCKSIEMLHIPSTVSSIGVKAFLGCSRLKHVKLPPTLERIEMETFYKCGMLEYIEIPSTVSFIGRTAFCHCRSLSHIRIPPSVIHMRDLLLRSCDNLVTVELPPGIFFYLDLSGCLSLVNVYGDIEYHSSFLLNTKLDRVFDDEADLFRKVKHRFDNSPLNQLCYYQSYHSSADSMMQLRNLMEDDQSVATTQVDEFGMTPLHVLSLSQTPNMDMLLALMNEGRADDIIRSKDSFGSTPMDYLCLNRMPNSSEVIRKVFQARFDHWLGSGSEGSAKSDALRHAVDEALLVDWASRRREIGKVYFELAKYEQHMEVLSLVELWLWKLKIGDVSSKEEAGDRERCRINSGASIVLPHVLPFLDRLDVEDYFTPLP